MRSPASRAREIAGRLTVATGGRARTVETADAVRVEADVPTEVTVDVLTAIIAALARADRFGHDRVGTGAVVWAEIGKASGAPHGGNTAG